jgi:hypothetical protein
MVLPLEDQLDEFFLDLVLLRRDFLQFSIVHFRLIHVKRFCYVELSNVEGFVPVFLNAVDLAYFSLVDFQLILEIFLGK